MSIKNSSSSLCTQCSDVVQIIDLYAQTKPLVKQVYYVTGKGYKDPQRLFNKSTMLECGVVHNRAKKETFYPSFDGNIQVGNDCFCYKFLTTAHNRYLIFCHDDNVSSYIKTIVIIDTFSWKIVKINEFKETCHLNSLLFHNNKLYIGIETGIRILEIKFEFNADINITGDTFIPKKIGKLICAFGNKLICVSDMTLKFVDLNFRHLQTIHIPPPRDQNTISDVVVNGDNELFVLHGSKWWDDSRRRRGRYTIIPNTVSTITFTRKYVVSTSAPSTPATLAAGNDHHHFTRRMKKMEKYGKLIRPEPLLDLQSPQQSSLSFISTTIGTKSDFNHIILNSRGSCEIKRTEPGSVDR